MLFLDQCLEDKVIMSFTGHKSLEVFNKYYKPNKEDEKDWSVYLCCDNFNKPINFIYLNYGKNKV